MEKTTIRFSDLPVEIQEKVRAFYVEDETHTEIFSEDCRYRLSELFKDSCLDVMYSLGYCQGDGLTIFGTLYYSDIVDKIDYKAYGFTEKEEKFIRWAVKNDYGYSVEIPHHHRYFYFPSDSIDFAWNIQYDLERDWIRGIKYKALEKFERACCDYFEELCARFENDGYEYFYEPSEDELQYLYDEYTELFTEESA